jgi:flagellar biosynthesis GTPase FlhF
MSTQPPEPTPGSSTPASTAPGDVRTYRGRTIEELIPRIRAELGPGAIILRERQGLTGGIAGFFAQRCVEVDAQAPQRLDVYADDLEELDDVDEDQEVDEETFTAAATPAPAPAAAPAPDPFAPFAAPAPPESSATPQPFAETLEVAAAEPDPAEPVSPAPAALTAAPGFIAFDELTEDEPRLQDAPAPAPADPLRAIAVPVRIEARATPPAAALETTGVFRAAAVVAPEPEPEPAIDRTAERELMRRLTDRGFGTDFATALVAEAMHLVGPGNDATAALQSRIHASLPQPASLPLAGGAIALVGPGGSGKTRAVAAMATVCARAGHTVTVARLGTPERSNELAELLRGENVQVIPAMRTRATAAAVDSARARGLVIVDTTSVSAGDRTATEVLAETLAPFALDAVLLAVPATFTARVADRVVQGFDAVRLNGLIATHVDEADGVGAIAQVAIGRRLALGHTHTGLDLATAVATVDPGRLAGALVA